MKITADKVYGVWFSEVASVDPEHLGLWGIERGIIVAHDSQSEKLIGFTEGDDLQHSDFYDSEDGTWFEVLEPYVLKHNNALAAAFGGELSSDALTFLLTNTIFSNDDHSCLDGKRMTLFDHNDCQNLPKRTKGKKGAWAISLDVELRVDSESKSVSLLKKKQKNTDEIIALLLDQGSQCASIIR